MNEVGLERMKERFRERCRLGAAAGHALTNTQDSEAIPKGGAGILTAAVAMKIKPGRVRRRRIAASKTARVRQVSRVAPRHQARLAGVLIHHDRQVTPLPGHREIRDIADPNLIHSGDSRSPQVIRMLCEKAMQARIGPVQPSRARPQSAFPHEAFYAPSTQAMPLNCKAR